MNTILLTGPTGFIGTFVCRDLLEQDCSIIALVREKDDKAAAARLKRVWWDFPELAKEIGNRVHAMAGNTSSDHLGLSEEAYANLARTLTHIVHSAADIRLNAPLEELRYANVQGVKNILDLAFAVHEDHVLARLSHVSTAYVAGRREGEIAEDSLSDEFGFLSNYERSKYEGELLIRDAKKRIPISVFRPGMVVGDSRTGWIKTFNTLYYPLRLYLNGHLRLMPLRASQRVNLVPVDYVANAIVKLTFDQRAEGKNFHLTAPLSSQPTAKELVLSTREWAQTNLDVHLPRPLFFPLSPLIPKDGEGDAQHQRSKRSESLSSLSAYLVDKRAFLTDNAEQLLGKYQIDWNELLPPLLKFATEVGFMHQTERTVSEQVLFRLDSKRRPVTLSDIVDGKVVRHDQAEIKKDILSSVASIRAMGIRPGDRVALVGLNSTRYLTLEVAIGLAGAVSVPLYYTSPPAEINTILSDCSVRAFFVGTPVILGRLEEIEGRMPIVSFCRGPLPSSGSGRAMDWNEFLSLGKGGDSTPYLVGLQDPMTIRYTSSTTGAAKGAMFAHGQVRWMAGTIAALPPWKLRNNAISYLSALPMNHVVEGIMGMYSPYYAPAPISIYFLENFREIQNALKIARPSVFFSVPRFYEKAWDKLMEDRTAMRYARSHNGIRRSFYRRMIKRAFLRHTGLDRCGLFVVGSSPASDSLLNAYHELGIEVLNAYGLTEAPLITINRPGENRIGTVGKPLPQTQVRTAEDGELMVKGPQVTIGYFGKKDQPFRDGWLLTGDYGRMTDEGYLVLLGRKKELIKTSYGKFVHPMKVETRLRSIPGVKDAMLIGEGRPFCTALLFIGDEGIDQASTAHAIEEVNRDLSGPEQVKRFALISDQLSIENGDLTSNLKLKRYPLETKYKEVIEAMYRGAALKNNGPEAGGMGGRA